MCVCVCVCVCVWLFVLYHFYFYSFLYIINNIIYIYLKFDTCDMRFLHAFLFITIDFILCDHINFDMDELRL